MEIRKARKKAKREIDDMKENMYVWSWGYIMIIVCSLVQNGAFQRDILQLGKKTIEWWLEYAEWFENLEYLGYSAGEVLFERSFATVYKGNIIKNLIMDCQSYTKYRPNETTGGIFVSWRRKEELPTGA